jgi:1-aminocyclopropane-1-carboxylate deaminase/D-cysteine desulfhydrase-like pyridoxal-dependent ACC family enzyme
MIPLFTRFPNLLPALPHRSVGSFPTPVEKLDGLGKKLGRGDLFVKCDNLSGPLYGGNKVRKLEFLLADAAKKGARRVITMGAAGSNHALATALYARAAGLKAALLLFEQPASSVVRNNLLTDAWAGADLHYEATFETLMKRLPEIMRRYAETDGCAPYFIPAGGSSATGAVGYVNAAFELKLQIDNDELPLPAVIFCPFGTMGTVAGLALGLRAAGLASRVVAARVVPKGVANREKCAALVDETATILCRRDPEFPQLHFSDCAIDLNHDYFEPGYGEASQTVIDAVALAESADDLHLDTTYSGKAFAAFIAAARAGKEGPLLFWNTKNSVPLPEEAMAIDYHRLPEPLHRYFEE